MKITIKHMTQILPLNDVPIRVIRTFLDGKYTVPVDTVYRDGELAGRSDLRGVGLGADAVWVGYTP